MGRSTKKGPHVDVKLLRKVERQEETGAREPIKTWARACTIVPEFVGHTFLVHNGRTHLRVLVTEDMVGHKLGEFSPTRVFRGHSGKKAAMAAAAAAPGAAPAPGAPAPRKPAE
jgi:small subunit ribosomal protein S19